MKTILNEKTEETVKKIHLLTTTLCARHCKYCCNNLYSVDEIPAVTDEELSKCEILFLTGGEPFQFCNPNEIAKYYKTRYPNIQKVIVYSNCVEFLKYLEMFKRSNLVGDYYNYDCVSDIDGVSLSIKNKSDVYAFEKIRKIECIFNCHLQHNRLYVFNNLYDKTTDRNFEIFQRKWQSLEEYRPAKDSIFRKMNKF